MASGQKMTREEFKKAKDLEEARKAGTAAPELDVEGNMINPHIPQYISQAPWYLNARGPGLQHQRRQDAEAEASSRLEEWYIRGEGTQKATKFRKGACENCGALTHKKKECAERPRKIGAKFTGDKIAADEATQLNLSLDFDGKRDRWNGYNPEDHMRIVEEYAKVDLAKKMLRAERLQRDGSEGDASDEKSKKEREKDASGANGDDADEDDEDVKDDEYRYGEDQDMPGQKHDDKKRITVRNLRIREDTAKYLRNLDPNSAYYDPKTRSMRENPYAEVGKDAKEVMFAGDNFVRISGDTTKMAQMQMFAWDAVDRGKDVHLQADPTKTELLHQQFKVKKQDLDGQRKTSILEKYGGEEHLEALPRELLLAQTEHYVEYSRTGKVIRGQEKAIPKSRYEEDVYTNNHTSVWGSFWDAGEWGYACCHSTQRNSYCTGEAGKQARKASQISLAQNAQTFENAKNAARAEAASALRDKERAAAAASKKDKARGKGGHDSDEEREFKNKVERAMEEQRLADLEAERLSRLDERKRPYNSLRRDGDTKVTDEDMEAFKMKRIRTDDPMAQFLSK
eukprot:Opistho-2@23549